MTVACKYLCISILMGYPSTMNLNMLGGAMTSQTLKQTLAFDLYVS